LWMAKGPHENQVAGVHIFFFDDAGKIECVAAFREPFARERVAHLL
jgi:hypothetical protein